MVLVNIEFGYEEISSLETHNVSLAYAKSHIYSIETNAVIEYYETFQSKI